MPTYTFTCPDCKANADRVLRVENRDIEVRCLCGERMVRRIVPTMVAVFNPYRTVVHDKETGKTMMIRSRDEHRAFLRRNGYEEVGNDASLAPPTPEQVADSHRQQEIDRASQPAFEFDPSTHEAIQ